MTCATPRGCSTPPWGEPVAILKGGTVVVYLVPAKRPLEDLGHRYATMEELQAHVRESREQVQPVLDWLRDK